MAKWCWPFIQTYCNHTMKCNWSWDHDRKCNQYAKPKQFEGLGQSVDIFGYSSQKRRSSSHRRRSSSSGGGTRRRRRKFK